MVVRKMGGSIFNWWGNVVGVPKRSILIAGTPGAGKTEAAKHFVYQILFEHSSLMIVYDHKADCRDFFDMHGIEYIRISMEDLTRVWNLFQEFSTSHDIDELARTLFPELSGDENDFVTTWPDKSSQPV